jgi:arylsulfatase A-like enzyme
MIAWAQTFRSLGLLAFILTKCIAAEPSRENDKPNIVLIMADDLGYGSLGCYGNPNVKTPHIDQLAATGVRLTDFHSNGPYCSPTRAALMTGRYPQRCTWVPDEELSPVFRTQRQANQKQRWAWGISRNEITLPSLLQKAGYRTALIGKWHLGYDEAFHPMNFGFDEFRGFMGGNVDYHTHIAGYGQKQLDWWQDRKIENQEGYTTDLLTRSAKDFIERHKDKPFFLYFAHAAPHEPWQGRNLLAKKLPSATYQEMIEVLDESVGAVLKTLRDNDLESRTLFIFCSDNGPAPPKNFAANADLIGKKGDLHEGGHRVPCILRWPTILPAGKTHAGTEMTMDFFPTITAITGAMVPAAHTLDGRDILPFLQGTKPAPARILHWQSGNAWAVRQGIWKLLGNGTTATALHDLNTSHREFTNLLNEQPDVTKNLLQHHRQWQDEVGTR